MQLKQNLLEKNTFHASLHIKALISFLQNPKTFQDSPSYQILRHMHEALNIDKNKN